MKKFKTILILILLCSNIAFGQNKDSISDIIFRIEKIEGFQENSITKIDNKSVEIDNKFTKLEQDLKDDNNYMKTLLWIFGSITVLGLFIGWYTVYKNAVKFANQKVEEKLEKFFDDKKLQFIELIKSHELEAILKQNKKLLLLSGNHEDNEIILKLFKKFDFANVKNTVFTNFENIHENSLLKENDLIVLNNMSNPQSFSNENLEKLLVTMSDYKNSFLYYGTLNPKLFGYKNINFANSEFTLYTRILETLKTQNILTK